MTERIRINKLKLDSTLSGKPVVHLHAPGAQYSQYPVLYLFDPGLLIAVGIDPNSLEPDKDVHVNLWAHYEVSEKLNSKGNPYKNVISLERIDALATTTSTDNSAVLAELRAIKALLLELATGPSPVPELGRGSQPRLERDTPPAAQAERVRKLNHVGSAKDPQATEPPEELTEAQARTAFYELAGPAITEGTDPGAVNDLTALANGDGWNTALAGLKKLLADN